MVDFYEDATRAKKKWLPIVESVDAGKSAAAADKEFKTLALCQLLENTARETMNEQKAPNQRLLKEDGNFTTGIDIVDPVLISLVRRTAPNLLAYDIVGVQPMNMPTGLVFCLRAIRSATQPVGPFGNPTDARYNAGATLDSHGNTPAQDNAIAGSAANEAFYQESPDTYSGTGTQTSNASAPNYSAYSVGTGFATTVGETLGRGQSGDAAFAEMTFTIEKQNVTAQMRALKAMYTFELQQDLRAVHGLDAEKLLADILSTEILAETNREIVNRIRQCAKIAAAVVEYSNGSVVTDSDSDPVYSLAGSFDVNINSDGRWQAEKYKSLLMKIGMEANAIAKDTRRGKGNFIICSSNVATALDLSGKLIYSPAVDNNLPADDTGNTFVGILQGRYKVYIDPYLGYDEIIVGYKGPNQMDAGFFYCPYVPLQMYKALGENDFQPKMAFKTRYGVVANPFTTLNANGNTYYRKFVVTGL
jgi:hypothetical protein